MAKVLVIRKTDKTIHVVPMLNKAFVHSFNNRQSAEKKWKIEEMEEEEAANLPFVDETYITASEAQDKVKQLESSNSDKDKRIAELEAMLAANDNSGKANQGSITAADLIAKIATIESIDELNAIIGGGETRVTVLTAINKRIAELEAIK